MASKRRPVSASLRWSVFARDGFTCRYCGAQAGQEGVDLHADHVVSVADGGDNSFDNLVTACQRCNGGKGARSLKDAPTAAEVVERIIEKTKTLRDQAEAIDAASDAREEARQSAVNLKCAAYGVKQATFQPREASRIIQLCQIHGADKVLEWYTIAFDKNVTQWQAIRYVHGIIRKIRSDEEAANA